MNFTAYVASDLYDAGRSDDGHPFIAEAFFVVLQSDTGLRLRHNVTFPGAQLLVDDETGEPHFADLRVEAAAKAERLADRVNGAIFEGRDIDPACWFEIDPAYGSDEYVGQGIEAQRAYADRLAA